MAEELEKHQTKVKRKRVTSKNLNFDYGGANQLSGKFKYKLSPPSRLPAGLVTAGFPSDQLNHFRALFNKQEHLFPPHRTK